MDLTRIFIVPAFIAAASGGHPLRADDRKAEIERLNKEIEALSAMHNAQMKAIEEKLRKARTEAEAMRKELQKKLAELEKEFPLGPQHPPLPRIDPPVLQPTAHGEVTDVAGDLATLDIGIDAGMKVGTVLNIYRVDGKTRIGTVKATDAFNLYPKQAVVKFSPVRKVPLKDLKPEELPKKGDLVRPMRPRD